MSGEGYKTDRGRFDDRRWDVVGSAMCDIRVDVHVSIREAVSRTAGVRDYIRETGHTEYIHERELQDTNRMRYK